jgi:allantoinase
VDVEEPFMSAARVFRSRRVVTPEGVRPASVHVRDGVITAVEDREWARAGADGLDFADAVLMPGVVDSHVHINEPGRTEWEGFETATRAAAAGGVTTVGDMPLNSVPATTTASAVADKSDAAKGKAAVDYVFWGGLVPGNARRFDVLDALLAAGVPGCKCFLVPSGVDEFEHVTEADLEAGMPRLAARKSALLVHAELPGPLEAAPTSGDPRAYATWLASRPRASENEAIALMIDLAARTGCRVHIVHLSSADALPALRAARRLGLPVTVETCPHYLTFAAEEIADGRTEFKCAPPIRERENRERLWEGLRDGTIDMVVSDHSPCTPELKATLSGDYLAAWGGISSLQLALPALWTGARARSFTLDDVAEWMCRRPASLLGLENSKGSIAPGRDADFVVWYPEREFSVEPALLRHRHTVTPYAGRALFGVVEKTFLRGEIVFDRGVFTASTSGRWLRPGRP